MGTGSKNRFANDIITLLQESKWWNYDPRQLLQIGFSNPEHFYEQIMKMNKTGEFNEWQPQTLSVSAVGQGGS